MDGNLNSFWEVLKIVLPALVVFLTAYFLLRDMFRNSIQRRELLIKDKTSEKILPLRLQAYERLALLLERISPQSLLLRVSPHDKSVMDYQQQLLAQIRSEFEHNFSQQIYVSPYLWESILSAKESIVGIINQSAEEVGYDKSGMKLSEKIIENYISEKNLRIISAMNELKKEVAKLF